MLFKSLSDIKEHAGFVAFSDKSEKLTLLQQDIEKAEDELSRKWLSKEFYDELHTAYHGDSIDAGTVQYEILNLTQTVLAHKTLYTGASKLNVNYQKSGIHSHTNDTEKPVREWMLADLKQQLLQDYCTHLDRLLRLMDENSGDALLGTWIASDQYKQNKGHIINSLDLFEKYYSLSNSHSTFFALGTAMSHVEETMLKKCLGKDFYTTIKAAILADNVDADMKELLEDHLYRIFAYMTIVRALNTMGLSIESGGIRINEYVSNLDTSQSTRMASIKDREVLAKQLNLDIRDAIPEMYAYLNEKATDAIFTDWFDSELYEDPAEDTEPTSMNQTDSGFFVV